MARQIRQLSAQTVKHLRAPGKYPDGANLYLRINQTGGKSWSFIFMLRGRRREMGLGAIQTVSLADARTAAEDCRKSLRDGTDPIEARIKHLRSARIDAANMMTFMQCATAYMEDNEAGWKNAKHRQQWRNTLSTYAYPVCGDLPVNEIDLDHVRKILEPIWKTKTDTAGKLRGRMETILDWATVRRYRSGENPARWRGHLDAIFPPPARIQHVRHHPALPYGEIADFITAVRDEKGTAALALEFLILTAARTSEALGAKWTEIDLAEKLWTVPADRIKGGREHRVPLSGAGIKLLREMRKLKVSDYVFPGNKEKRPLSNMALLQLLKRMQRTDITAHGFRSTFRDWAAELTNFPNEMVEMALAHVVGNKVEAAYRRGDMFEKRRKLMAAWASYCSPRVRLTPQSRKQIAEELDPPSPRVRLTTPDVF